MYMHKIATIVCACMLSIAAWAVQASPEPIEYTKADGTKVMARIYGDEFHSYIESLDGELLEGSRNTAALQAASRARRARRMEQGAGNAAFRPFVAPHSLVLLVCFSDLDFGETLEDFQNLLNQPGYNHNGATGSCRDYYIASSDSLFMPQFDCFGPYKLSHPMAYYGGNAGTSSNEHAADMVAEVCNMAHDAGVNFQNYDVNKDGMLDNVFIFFAGHNEAEGGGANTIWPHQSNISYLDVRLDGILVTSYACTSEYRGNSGNTRCGIGTFCHEFGHVIGQPDFYDTDYNYYSVANWDIMCNGSYNNRGNTPPTFSAYERMYEGWLTPKQLNVPGQYILTDVPFHKEAYLLAASPHNLSGSNPNPSEFFLLDYRSGANGWDAYLPGQGMLVWHIDYRSSAWNNNTPNNGPTIMRMHLEEANGVGWQRRGNSENGRASDVFPGTNNVTSFNPTLHDGTQLAQPIFNIKDGGGVISFTYISDGGTSLRVNKERLDLTTTVGDNREIVDWEPQDVYIAGSGFDPEQDVTLSVSSNSFLLYTGEEAPSVSHTGWRRNLTLRAQSDSTLQERRWVSFRPSRQNCEAVNASLNIASAGASLSLPLSGTAPRPVYVKIPKTTATQEITPYSFTAGWQSQEDAERYYLTLYQTEEGTTDFKQNFENFDDAAKIREQGWQSNTTLTTTSDKADGQRALYLKNHGDRIVSETYPSAVTKVSFWYNAFAAILDSIGALDLEAYNGEEWTLIEHMVMTKNSKRVTKTLEFSEEDNYRMFRLTWLDYGAAGLALDAFTATTSQKISYLYKGKDLSLSGYTQDETLQYTFGNLNPANTYYYQVQCTDLDKGCEEHLTELSEPVKVTTQEGKPLNSKQLTIGYDSINYNPAQHAVYVLEPHNGDYLFFYSGTGRLVMCISVQADTYIYPLDLKLFTRGEVYMIQHAVNGRLGRKQKWVKFVY